jgi:streptogramin lyase
MSRRLIAWLVAASFLTACASPGQSSPAVPSAAANRTAPVTDKARALVSIRIPHPARHSRYVSPNTKSMTIAANGKRVGTFSLTPTSQGCAPQNGSTLCRFHVGIPSGHVTFVVKMFDAAAGKGNMLSTGSIVQTVPAGALTPIALTLSGVVGSVKLALQVPNPQGGAAGPTSIFVTAFDKSGAAIVGPGNYNVPLTLTDSDASGTTSLVSATVITHPGQIGTLNYNGNSIVSATIGASAAGVPASLVIPAVFRPVPAVVANYSLPPPIASDEPEAIVKGPDGNLWFTTNVGATEAIVKMTTAGAMNVFEGGAQIPTNDRYFGIAVGPDGALWFTERDSKRIGRITPAGVVTEYPAHGSAGTACPNRIVAGPVSDGGMWFTSSCLSLVGRISMTGVVQTYATGFGANTQTILLGKDSDMYLIDRSNDAIAQLISNAGGSSITIHEVAIGPNPIDGGSNDAMLGLAQTGDGTLWFTNQACTPSTIGSLPIASPFTASTPHQNLTLQGCSTPAFLTVAPAGSQTLWIPEFNQPTIEQGVAPAGGAAPPALTDTLIGLFSETPINNWAITLGPDGNLWALARGTNPKILKIVY